MIGGPSEHEWAEVARASRAVGTSFGLVVSGSGVFCSPGGEERFDDRGEMVCISGPPKVTAVIDVQLAAAGPLAGVGQSLSAMLRTVAG